MLACVNNLFHQFIIGVQPKMVSEAKILNDYQKEVSRNIELKAAIEELKTKYTVLKKQGEKEKIRWADELSEKKAMLALAFDVINKLAVDMCTIRPTVLSAEKVKIHSERIHGFLDKRLRKLLALDTKEFNLDKLSAKQVREKAGAVISVLNSLNPYH